MYTVVSIAPDGTSGVHMWRSGTGFPFPGPATAEEGMAEARDKTQLSDNAEDGALADAILRT